jgi:hypothetical protein
MSETKPITQAPVIVKPGEKVVKIIISTNPKPDSSIRAPKNDYITEGFDLNRKKRP